MSIKTLLTRIFSCVGLGLAFIAILVAISSKLKYSIYTDTMKLLIFGGLFALVAFGLKLVSTFSDQPRVNTQQMMMQQRMVQQTRATLGMNSGNYLNAAPMRPAMPPVNSGMAPGGYPNATPMRQTAPSASPRPAANPTVAAAAKPTPSAPANPATPPQNPPSQS